MLTALGLPEDPNALLASHARRLDGAYQEGVGRLVDGRAGFAEPGRPAGLAAGDAAASVLPAELLEVMSW